jgi:hypothetical protein
MHHRLLHVLLSRLAQGSMINIFPFSAVNFLCWTGNDCLKCAWNEQQFLIVKTTSGLNSCYTNIEFTTYERECTSIVVIKNCILVGLFLV